MSHTIICDLKYDSYLKAVLRSMTQQYLLLFFFVRIIVFETSKDSKVIIEHFKESKAVRPWYSLMALKYYNYASIFYSGDILFFLF